MGVGHRLRHEPLRRLPPARRCDRGVRRPRPVERGHVRPAGRGDRSQRRRRAPHRAVAVHQQLRAVRLDRARRPVPRRARTPPGLRAEVGGDDPPDVGRHRAARYRQQRHVGRPTSLSTAGAPARSPTGPGPTARCGAFPCSSPWPRCSPVVSLGIARGALDEVNQQAIGRRVQMRGSLLDDHRRHGRPRRGGRLARAAPAPGCSRFPTSAGIVPRPANRSTERSRLAPSSPRSTAPISQSTCALPHTAWAVEQPRTAPARCFGRYAMSRPPASTRCSTADCALTSVALWPAPTRPTRLSSFERLSPEAGSKGRARTRCRRAHQGPGPQATPRDRPA